MYVCVYVYVYVCVYVDAFVCVAGLAVYVLATAIISL